MRLCFCDPTRMARPLRICAPRLLHHVFTRGDNKGCVFADDEDNRLFLGWLGDGAQRFGVEVVAYCLMGNHYHLVLVPQDPKAISRLMHQLNSRYCQRFNRRHGRVGHVLHGRFGSRIVEDGAYARSVLRYLALNPVAAGLAAGPEAWPWSSYRVAMGREAVPDYLALHHVWKAFGTADPEVGRSRLALFVDAGLEETFPNSLLHGTPWLHEQIGPELAAHATNWDFTCEQRFAARPSLDVLLDGSSDRQSLQLAAHKAFTRHGYTLAELGRALGRDPSTICRWIRCAKAHLKGFAAQLASGEDTDARNKI